jgi:hypothetical protein
VQVYVCDYCVCRCVIIVCARASAHVCVYV